MATFTPKTWTDTATSGTPLTAAELNRIEQGIAGAYEQLPSSTGYGLVAVSEEQPVDANVLLWIKPVTSS